MTTTKIGLENTPGVYQKTPQNHIQYAVFPHDFPKFPQNFLKFLGKCSNSKAYLDICITQIFMISFATHSGFHGLQFDILFYHYERFIPSSFSNLEKFGKFRKNGLFSGRIRHTAQADMAGLGSIVSLVYLILLNFLCVSKGWPLIITVILSLTLSVEPWGHACTAHLEGRSHQSRGGSLAAGPLLHLRAAQEEGPYVPS